MVTQSRVTKFFDKKTNRKEKMNTHPPIPTQTELDNANRRRRAFNMAAILGTIASAFILYAWQFTELEYLPAIILCPLAYVIIYASLVLREGDMHANLAQAAVNPALDANAQKRTGVFLRWITYFAFSGGIVGYGGWTFIDYFIIEPFDIGTMGQQFYGFIIFLLFFWSSWSSFDDSTIKLNRKATILWFGVPLFHNITHGFTCLGLPRWLVGIKIVYVDLKVITIGDSDDKTKTKPFIRETPAGEVKITMTITVQADDTEQYLLVDDNPPADEFSPKVEYAIVQDIITDLYGKLTQSTLDPQGNPERDTQGNLKPLYPSVKEMRSATAQIARDMMEGRYVPKDETLMRKIAKYGIRLVAINLKEVNATNDQVTNAALANEAQDLIDEAERKNNRNVADKTLELYNRLNRIGDPNEIPDDKKMSMKQCLEEIQRQEGGRRIIEVGGPGGARTIVDSR